MCLFSFIVPLYNKEKYIKRCLLSICEQKGDDIQIIVVDDGSTDNSKEIVYQLQEKDNRIEYFYQDNGGVSKARNRGIKSAKGKWVTFIDADDYISKDYMSIVRMRLDDEVDCFVMGSYITYNGALRESLKYNWLCRTWRTGNVKFIYEYLCGKTVIVGTSSWNKIYKRQIIEKNKLKFLPFKIGEDKIFCMDYAMHSNMWVGIPSSLYYYVQNEESVMHQYNMESIEESCRLMDHYEKFGKQYGFYEQIKPAVSCANVADIFTIIKIIDGMYPNMRKVYKEYKKIMRATYFREKIKCVDVKNLRTQYKVVYYLLKFRMALMMIVLVKLYNVIYKL